MDSNKKSIEVRSQKSEDRRWKGRQHVLAGLLTILLALAFTPDLRAQAFVTGGPATLGNFKNPTSVDAPPLSNPTGPPAPCNFLPLVIDLKLGKVFATPQYTSTSVQCLHTPVDITALTFSTGITSFGVSISM